MFVIILCYVLFFSNPVFLFSDSFLDQWSFTHPSPTGVLINAENENKLQMQGHGCEICGRVYSHYQSLRNHQKFECGKTAQFACPHCRYRCKRKGNMKAHIIHVHMRSLQNPDELIL